MELREVVTKQGRKVPTILFFECDTTQLIYLKRLKDMIDALEEQWGDSYKPPLHDMQVAELIRSEIMAEKYEMLLANNRETELTPMLLKQERVQVGILRGKFLMPLDQVKREEPDAPQDSPPSLMEMAENAFIEEDLILEPPEPDDPSPEEEDN